MGTAIGILLLCGLLVGAFLFLTNKKVKGRVKARANEFSDRVADSIGDVTDDRAEAISNRKQKNRDLEKKLTGVLVEIKSSKSRADTETANAKKYAGLAKDALRAGKRDAARQYLEMQESSEEIVMQLLLAIETLQDTFEGLKAQLDASKGEVDNAEQQAAAFEARHAALELRREMDEAAGCFGENSLDFTQYENELRQQELQLEAAEEMGRTAGQSAIAEFEREQAQAERDSKLDALEAELQAEAPDPTPKTAEAPAPAVEPPVSTYTPSDDSNRYSGGYGGGASSDSCGSSDSGGSCDSGGGCD